MPFGKQPDVIAEIAEQYILPEVFQIEPGIPWQPVLYNVLFGLHILT
jgi:ABC-type taurine transport system ATPase subunit